MKIVVFSDAHGNSEIIDHILAFNKDADYVISLGDAEVTEEFLVERDIIMIKGNSRRDPGFVYQRDFEVEDKRIYLTHGHKQKVNKGIDNLVKETVHGNYDCVLYGHTHIAKKDVIMKTHFINPGSCVSPRNMLPPTYLIIEIKEGDITYTLKDSLDNNTIEV
jgi:putative phosphoesterase